MENQFNLLLKNTTNEKSNRQQLVNLFNSRPIPENEILANLGLFVNRQLMSRILFMNDLYKLALPLHGSFFEFGTRWGQNMSLMQVFRGIYEPFNYSRKLVAFDTFSGFPVLNKLDGHGANITPGGYGVSEKYEDYLTNILDYHNSENPIAHIKKFELVKGDASVELEKYLSLHPETLISFAYFDFDIYEPTKKCLALIRPYLVKGAVIGFDEINHPDWPGETIALREIFGSANFKIQRTPYSSYSSYFIYE
jgi:hypothetical protein